MKLTLQQITLLTDGAREAVASCTGKAKRAEGVQTELHAFWLAEAEAARQLVHLLSGAQSVTVESVDLTPTGEACGDIHCHGRHPVPTPPLILAIDACDTVEAALIKFSGSTQAGRRNASRYLRVSMHDLPEEITRRVRARLLKPL